MHIRMCQDVVSILYIIDYILGLWISVESSGGGRPGGPSAAQASHRAKYLECLLLGLEERRSIRAEPAECIPPLGGPCRRMSIQTMRGWIEENRLPVHPLDHSTA